MGTHLNDSYNSLKRILEENEEPSKGLMLVILLFLVCNLSSVTVLQFDVF